MLVIPFVFLLLLWKAYQLFIAFVNFIPPIVWLTFGSLAVAVSVAAAGSYLLVQMKRKRNLESQQNLRSDVIQLQSPLSASPISASPVSASQPPSSSTSSSSNAAPPLTPFEQAFLYEPPATLTYENQWQFLVLCSPVSGSGEGVEVYERILKPMLRKARIRSEVVFLEKGNQAFETAADLDTNCYSGMIVIGGDKVLHEVLQGLAVRAYCDIESPMNGAAELSSSSISVSSGQKVLAQLLSRLVLGIIPCGSRNGLGTSLGLIDTFIASKKIVEGVVLKSGKGKPVDLYTVKRISDMPSKWQQTVLHKTMIGGVSTSSTDLTTMSAMSSRSSYTIERPSTSSTTTTMTSSSSTMFETDEDIKRAQSSFPIYDFFLTSWGVLADVTLFVERGYQFLPWSFRMMLACIYYLIRIRPKQGTVTLTVQAIQNAELLNTPLPAPEQKTVILTGSFTLVSVSNVSRLTQEMVLAPGARPDDGRLHVAVIRHCSRWHALRTLLAGFSGEEVSDFPWVQSYVCSRVVIANETGEVDICGFGEEELVNRRYKGDGVVIDSVPRLAYFFY